jgi:hypothetical protein
MRWSATGVHFQPSLAVDSSGEKALRRDQVAGPRNRRKGGATSMWRARIRVQVYNLIVATKSKFLYLITLFGRCLSSKHFVRRQRKTNHGQTNIAERG